MAEYIDREEAKQFFNLNFGGVSHAIIAARLLDEIPAVDAVPVVRCKDCKYLRVHNTKELYAFCPKTNTAFLPFELDTRTHFCSLGEEKDEANES